MKKCCEHIMDKIKKVAPTTGDINNIVENEYCLEDVGDKINEIVDWINSQEEYKAEVRKMIAAVKSGK